MRDKIAEILDLIKINKFKEAKIKCDSIKKHFDENLEFLHIYGFIFFSLNNYEKAIEQWEKAIKINPKFVDGLNNLGNAFFRIGKFDEAINYLNKALSLRPNFLHASASNCQPPSFRTPLKLIIVFIKFILVFLELPISLIVVRSRSIFPPDIPKPGFK